MSSSDDDNVVVLPVPDSLSDGDESTWRLDDPQFKYRMIDDTRWRLALAQMWVEKTGAIIEGKSLISFALIIFSGFLQLACRAPKEANESRRELSVLLLAFSVFYQPPIWRLRATPAIVLILFLAIHPCLAPTVLIQALCIHPFFVCSSAKGLTDVDTRRDVHPGKASRWLLSL
jgi:hypothetical protein